MSLDQLDDLASFLDNWPDLIPDIAAKAAPEIQRVARSEYASGKGPDGQHPPRKKDGALALQRPLSTVTFAGVGAEIRGSAEDVLKYHQGPIVKAKFPERKTFPGDGDPLPGSWAEEIDKAAESVFDKSTEALR